MSEEDILIDPQSALVAGTFAVICGLLGALANGITMAVILKDKKIRSHCTTPGKYLKSLLDFSIFSEFGKIWSLSCFWERNFERNSNGNS